MNLYRWMNIEEYLAREDVLPHNKALVKNYTKNACGTLNLLITTVSRLNLL